MARGLAIGAMAQSRDPSSGGLGTADALAAAMDTIDLEIDPADLAYVTGGVGVAKTLKLPGVKSVQGTHGRLQQVKVGNTTLFGNKGAFDPANEPMFGE